MRGVGLGHATRYGSNVEEYLREANAKIFLEDQVVVEAQQIMLDAKPAHGLRNLNIDAGSMRARRIIEDMIAGEKHGAA